MATLLDIANAGKEVETGGGVKITCYGISAQKLAALLQRFPALMAMFAGKGDSEALYAGGSDLLAAFIAAGATSNMEVDGEMEEAARRLVLQDQLDLATAILGLTFPRGVGPFVKGLEQIGALAQLGAVPSPQ